LHNSVFKQDYWQTALRDVVRDPVQLLDMLALPFDETVYLDKQPFALRVPKSYVARMRQGDWHDPLLQQVLPRVAEQQLTDGFNTDPVGDKLAEKKPRLLHKYQGRVLLLVSNTCATHCRYCFRRHYQHSEQAFSLTPAIYTHIRADETIAEVILSGGDPLCLPDSQLSDVIQMLATIPHVQRLRIHTRLPIVLPERVTVALLTSLTNTRLQVVIVVHANHANEIDAQVTSTLQQLVTAGMTVLNQSVLLRGVNDDSVALIALSEALFRAQVLPYYLHQLDRVQGAAHFEVPLEKACKLLRQMREKLPGYLVPKFVREVAGMGYKQVVD